MGVRPFTMVVLATALPSSVRWTCQDSPAPTKPLQTPLPIKCPYIPLFGSSKASMNAKLRMTGECRRGTSIGGKRMKEGTAASFASWWLL
jgi:hypothetical protein